MLSLRLRSAILTNLAVLVPLAAYLLWNNHLERQHLLESRIQVLRALGTLLVEEAAGMDGDQQAEERLRAALERFAQRETDLEVYLLDRHQAIRASTQDNLSGTRLEEPGIQRVIEEGDGFVWEMGFHGDLPVLGVTLPVRGSAGQPPRGAIHIAEPQALLQRSVAEARRRSTIFVFLLVLLVGGLVTWNTDRMVIRPLRRITERLRGTEWCGESAPKEGRDEIDVLERALSTLVREVERSTAELRAALEEKGALVEQVRGFNAELTAQVEAARHEILAMQEELLRKERLSTMGELAAALAHEVRNPLQIIRATAEMLKRHHPEASDDLADVMEEVDRLNCLVRELLDYAHPLRFDPEPVDLASLVDAAMAEVFPGSLPRGLHVELELPRELLVAGNPLLLGRLLANLLRNSREALQGRGIIKIRGQREGSTCRLLIEDTGCGIEDDDLPRVFEPFFSRKPAGTGMGLPLCRRIVEEHGGRIWIESEAGRGSVVSLELPCADEVQP